MLQVHEDLRGFFTACRIIKTSIRIPHITHIAHLKYIKHPNTETSPMFWNFIGFHQFTLRFWAFVSAGAPRFTSVQIVDSSRKSRSSWSASCEKKSSITTTRCLRFGLITRWEVSGKSLMQSVCLTIPHAIVEERIELPISSLFHCVFLSFQFVSHIAHHMSHLGRVQTSSSWTLSVLHRSRSADWWYLSSPIHPGGDAEAWTGRAAWICVITVSAFRKKHCNKAQKIEKDLLK